jgi:hypothetical protein
MASSFGVVTMNRKQCVALAIGILSAGLLAAVTGCSRGYKTGSAITSADLIKLLPEFPITLPPGGTNLYLEQDSHPPLVNSWLKLAVPAASLTNFLHSFGFPDDFMIATPQMIRLQKRISLPLPAGIDMRSAAAWVASTPRQARHAAEWDLDKATGPVRLYGVARPGMSSPNDQVILFGYVDGAATNNVTVYLEYYCLHK